MYKFVFLLALAVLAAAQAPVITSVSPVTGASSSTTITLTASDPNGIQDIAALKILMNSDMSTAGACYLSHNAGTASVFLRNDADLVWGPEVPFGSDAGDSNSQCSVSGIESSMLPGDSYTLKLKISFKSAFSGLRRIWVQAVDKSGSGASWKWQGDWIVPAESTPSGDLLAELESRPQKGADWNVNRAAIVGSDGKLSSAKGPATECLRVDGTSTTCSAAASRIDRFKFAGTPPGSVQLSAAPAAGSEPKVFRNGLLMAPGDDYMYDSGVVTFLWPGKDGDSIQVEYWTDRSP